MERWNVMKKGDQSRTKVIAIALVLVLTLSGVLLVVANMQDSPSSGGRVTEETGGSITYHLGTGVYKISDKGVMEGSPSGNFDYAVSPSGVVTSTASSSVSVKLSTYFGVKSTEYNPEFWSGWGEVPLYNGSTGMWNWAGPMDYASWDNLSITVKKSTTDSDITVSLPAGCKIHGSDATEFTFAAAETSKTIVIDYKKNVHKVFGGWTTDAANENPIVYPGDIVDWNVGDLYAKWIFPDLYAKTTDLSNVTVTVDGTTGNIDGLNTIITEYVDVPRTGDGKLHITLTDGNPTGYSSNTSVADRMFSTIYYLTAANATAPASGTPNWTKYTVDSGCNVPSGTYRTKDPYTIYNDQHDTREKKLLYKTVIYISGYMSINGNVIIDNVSFDTSKTSNHGGDTNAAIIANGNRFIMGTNISTLVLEYEGHKDVPKDADTGGFNHVPCIIGGKSGALNTILETNKTVYLSDEEKTTLEVNIGTFVIVHSGLYGSVVGGCVNGVLGADNNPLSSYMILKDCLVHDTVMAGSSGGTGGVVRGHIQDATGYKDGGTFLYSVGLFTMGDYWEDKEAGYGNFVTGNNAGEFGNTREFTYNVQSSVTQGGGNTGKVYGSAHLIISGDSSVWDCMPGGRGAESMTEYAYMEITGIAHARRAACGTITDGSNNGDRDSVLNGVRIYVGGNPTIASLFGAGFDTWSYPSGKSMKTGTIDIEITGGTIGDVYGGGYRGSIGTESNLNLLTINIHISGDDTVIEGDVYGGGSGGLNKMKHYTGMVSGKAYGQGFQTGNGKDGNRGSTGKSYVYGNINVTIDGGAVMGSVYGGGMSVPKLSSYNYVDEIGSFTYEGVDVATVVGDVTVKVSGNAVINGSVFGAGKGISMDSDGKVKTEDYGFNKVLYSDGLIKPQYWVKGDGSGNVNRTYDNTIDYTNYAQVKGNVTLIIENETWHHDYEHIIGDTYTVSETNANKDNCIVLYRGDTLPTNYNVIKINGDSISIEELAAGSTVTGVDGWKVNGTTISGNYTVNANDADRARNIILCTNMGSNYTVAMIDRTDSLTFPADATSMTFTVDKPKTEENVVVNLPRGCTTNESDTSFTIAANETVKTVTINKTAKEVFTVNLPDGCTVATVSMQKNVTANSVVDLRTCIVEGSAYAGGGFSKVYGSTMVNLDSGIVTGNVFGGGLGLAGKISIEGSRAVYIEHESSVSGSVYGGSETGIDGATISEAELNNPTDDTRTKLNKNRSFVVVQGGFISGSVFGGGLMGDTYGNTAVYIGYYLPSLVVRNPVANDYTGSTGVLISLDSVFAGGNISTGDDSSVLRPYTQYLVQGSGMVDINGDSNESLVISGSIMGSGNACLTRGETTIDINSMYNSVKMGGIHRADKVTIMNSALGLSGRSSITPVFGQIKTVSVYHVGELILKGASTIQFDAPMDDIGALRSLTSDGMATTEKSPLNRMVFANGTTIYIRSADATGNPVYREIEGFVQMVSMLGNYGAYAMGLTSSSGGFSVVSDSSMKEADTSVSDDMCCWYMSGISKKIATLSLQIPNSYDGSVINNEGHITVTKFQADTQLMFTGGVFTKLSNDPNGDPYTFVRPGADSIDDNPSQLSLALGYYKVAEPSIVLYDPTYRSMSADGSPIDGNEQGTFFKKDGRESDLEDEYRNRSLTSVPMEYARGAGASTRTIGNFDIYMELSGKPIDNTSYVGYLTLVFQEIKQINYEYVSDDGEIVDSPKYLVASTIEVRVDIYIYGSAASSNDSFSVEIKLSEDEYGQMGGESSTLIPQTYEMAVLDLDDVEIIGAGSGSMPDAGIKDGVDYIIPECTYLPPSGKTFQQWKLTSGNSKEDAKPGDILTVSGNRIAINGVTTPFIISDNTITITPVWTTSVNVLFDADGGTGTMSSKPLVCGIDYVLPECTFTAPTEMIFAEWSLVMGVDNAERRQPGDTVTVTGDIILKAVWATKQTMTFNGNGGGSSMAAQYAAKGWRFTVPDCGFTPATGNSFKYWEVDGTIKYPGDSILVTKDLEFKAHWVSSSTDRTVNFSNGGGTGTMSPVYVADGAKYRLPECGFTAPDGKVFSKWTLSMGGIVLTDYQPGDLIKLSANLTVTAEWASEQEIRFAAGDHATGTMASISKPYDSYLVIPGPSGFTPESSYVFDHWEDERKNRYYPDQEVLIRSSLPLTAVWEFASIKNLVVFDADGGTGYMPMLKKADNATYTLPNCGFDAPAGKVFWKWSVSIDGAAFTDMNPGTSITVSGDTIIKAVWYDEKTGSTPNYYTIQIKESAGPVAAVTIKIKKDAYFETPVNIFTAPAGQVFSGWSVTGTYTSKQVLSDLVFIPTWETATSTELNFDSGRTVSGKIVISAMVNQDNTTGWSNLGNPVVWNLATNSIEGHNYVGTLLGNITGNVSFKAQNISFIDSDGDPYMPTIDLKFDRSGVEAHTILTFAEIQYYKIIFVDHGVQTEKYYPENTILTREQCESPSGQNFNGWFLDEKYINRYDYNMVVNDESDGMYLYARYTYVVTLDNMNGTTYTLHVSEEDKGALLGEKELPVPTYVGYVFAGWCKDKDLIYDWGYQSDRITEDTTLYARWIGKDVRIYFWFEDSDGKLNLFDGTSTGLGPNAEGKYDLQKAYMINADRKLYPTVTWGSSFDVKNPYDAQTRSLMEIAEQTINFQGQFVKWTVFSPTDIHKHIGIYDDTIVGTKVLKYVTDDMMEGYSDLWEYYLYNDGGFPRTNWVGEGRPNTMEIHLVAETTKVAIVVEMGLSPEDEQYSPTVTIDDPEEFLVYPNGPSLTDPVAVYSSITVPGNGSITVDITNGTNADITLSDTEFTNCEFNGESSIVIKAESSATVKITKSTDGDLSFSKSGCTFVTSYYDEFGDEYTVQWDSITGSYYLNSEGTVRYYYDSGDKCWTCLDVNDADVVNSTLTTAEYIHSITFPRTRSPYYPTRIITKDDQYGNTLDSESGHYLKTVAYAMDGSVEKMYLVEWKDDKTGEVIKYYDFKEYGATKKDLIFDKTIHDKTIPSSWDPNLEFYLKDTSGNKYIVTSISKSGANATVNMKSITGNYYEFTYKLNNAVRNGYTLTGWHNEYISIENALSPSPNQIRKVHVWTESDGFIYRAILISADADGNPVEIPLTVGNYVVDPKDADSEGNITIAPGTTEKPDVFTVKMIYENRVVGDKVTLGVPVGGGSWYGVGSGHIADGKYTVNLSDADIEGTILISSIDTASFSKYAIITVDPVGTRSFIGKFSPGTEVSLSSPGDSMYWKTKVNPIVVTGSGTDIEYTYTVSSADADNLGNITIKSVSSATYQPSTFTVKVTDNGYVNGELNKITIPANSVASAIIKNSSESTATIGPVANCTFNGGSSVNISKGATSTVVISNSNNSSVTLPLPDKCTTVSHTIELAALEESRGFVGWTVDNTLIDGSNYAVSSVNADILGLIVLGTEWKETSSYIVKWEYKWGNNTTTVRTDSGVHEGDYLSTPHMDDDIGEGDTHKGKFIGWKAKDGMIDEYYTVEYRHCVTNSSSFTVPANGSTSITVHNSTSASITVTLTSGCNVDGSSTFTVPANGSIDVTVTNSNNEQKTVSLPSGCTIRTITITGIWEKNTFAKYTIQFVTDLGTAPSTRTEVTSLSNIEIPTIYAEGYRPLAWMVITSDNKTLIREPKYTLTESDADDQKWIIMVAVWAETFTIIKEGSNPFFGFIAEEVVELPFDDVGTHVTIANSTASPITITLPTGCTVDDGSGGTTNKITVPAEGSTEVTIINSNLTKVEITLPTGCTVGGSNKIEVNTSCWKVCDDVIVKGGQVTSTDNKFTMKYDALWQRIPYSVNLVQPTNGIVDVFLESRTGDNTTIHLTTEEVNSYEFHYGDKIRLTYTPNTSKVAFIRWIISGQYYISNANSSSSLMIVQGDCTISVDESTGRMMDVMIAFDDNNLNENDRKYTRVFMHDTVSGEYFEARYIPGTVKMDHYIVKVPYGDNYEVCLRYGETLPAPDGTTEFLPSFTEAEEYALVGNVKVTINGSNQAIYDIISAGFLTSIDTAARTITDFVDTEYGDIPSDSTDPRYPGDEKYDFLFQSFTSVTIPAGTSSMDITIRNTTDAAIEVSADGCKFDGANSVIVPAHRSMKVTVSKDSAERTINSVDGCVFYDGTIKDSSKSYSLPQFWCAKQKYITIPAEEDYGIMVTITNVKGVDATIVLPKGCTVGGSSTISFTSEEATKPVFIKVDRSVTGEGDITIKLPYYEFAETSGGGHPLRVLDADGKVVIKVTKYVGILRSTLAQLAARNLNINNPDGGTPPVVVKYEPNFTYSTYEGFPWIDGESNNVFAIETNINLAVDSDSNMQTTKTFYLNWVRTDSPADIILKINDMIPPEHYAMLDINKRNSTDTGYDVLYKDMMLNLGEEDASGYHTLEKQLDVIPGYTPFVSSVPSPDPSKGEYIHIDSSNVLHIKLKHGDHESTVIRITVNYERSEVYYAFNDTAFGVGVVTSCVSSFTIPAGKTMIVEINKDMMTTVSMTLPTDCTINGHTSITIPSGCMSATVEIRNASGTDKTISQAGCTFTFDKLVYTSPTYDFPANSTSTLTIDIDRTRVTGDVVVQLPVGCVFEGTVAERTITIPADYIGMMVTVVNTTHEEIAMDAAGCTFKIGDGAENKAISIEAGQTVSNVTIKSTASDDITLTASGCTFNGNPSITIVAGQTVSNVTIVNSSEKKVTIRGEEYTFNPATGHERWGNEIELPATFTSGGITYNVEEWAGNTPSGDMIVILKDDQGRFRYRLNETDSLDTSFFRYSVEDSSSFTIPAEDVVEVKVVNGTGEAITVNLPAGCSISGSGVTSFDVPAKGDITVSIVNSLRGQVYVHLPSGCTVDRGDLGIYAKYITHGSDVIYKIRASDGRVFDANNREVMITFYKKWTCIRENAYNYLTDTDITVVYADTKITFTALTTTEFVTLTFITSYGEFDESGSTRISVSLPSGGAMSEYYLVIPEIMEVAAFIDYYSTDDTGEYVFVNFKWGNEVLDIRSTTPIYEDREYIANWVPNEKNMKTFTYSQNDDHADITALKDAVDDAIIPENEVYRAMLDTEISISIQPESGYTIDLARTRGELGYKLVDTEIYVDITTASAPTSHDNTFSSWKLWNTGSPTRAGYSLTEMTDNSVNGFLVYVANWVNQPASAGNIIIVFAQDSGVVPSMRHTTDSMAESLPDGNWLLWGDSTKSKTGTYTVSARDAVNGFIVFVKEGTTLNSYNAIYASNVGVMSNGNITKLDHYYLDRVDGRYHKTNLSTVYRYENGAWKDYSVNILAGYAGLFIKQFSNDTDVYRATRDGTYYHATPVTYTATFTDNKLTSFTADVSGKVYTVHGSTIMDSSGNVVNMQLFTDLRLTKKISDPATLIPGELISSKLYSFTTFEPCNQILGFFKTASYSPSNFYGSEYECYETSPLIYDMTSIGSGQFRDTLGAIWLKDTETGEFHIMSVTVYTFNISTNTESAHVIAFNNDTPLTPYPADYYYKDSYGNFYIGNNLVNQKINTLYLKIGDDVETLTVKYIRQNEDVKALYNGDSLKYYIMKNGTVVMNNTDRTVVNGTLYASYTSPSVNVPYKGDYTLVKVDSRYNGESTSVKVDGMVYHQDTFGNMYYDWIGSPTQLPGTRGFIWTFFLEDDLDLIIYTKKISYNINFIVNGVKVGSNDLNVVSTVPTNAYSEEDVDFFGTDIPQYAIVAFDGPLNDRNIKWYTDPEYKNAYTVHNSNNLQDPREFIVDPVLPIAPTEAGKTFQKWRLWGTGDGYDAMAQISLKNVKNSSGEWTTKYWKNKEGSNSYFYVFEASWEGGNGSGTYKIVFASAYGTLTHNLIHRNAGDTVNFLDVGMVLSEPGMTFNGWKVWNTGESLTVNYTVNSSDAVDNYIILVADWSGVDVSNANNAVYASEYGSVPNMEPVRRYQFMSTKNISLYAHSGTYVLYLHDFADNPDKTIKYELSVDEYNQITIPSEHYGLGNYTFVGWSAAEDPETGKRLFTYVPGEKINVSHLTSNRLDLYPFYLSDGTDIRYYNGELSRLTLGLDDVLSEKEIIGLDGISLLEVKYSQFPISSITEGEDESAVETKHAGEYYIYYYAQLLTPLGDGDESYGNTQSYYQFPGKASLKIMKIDAYVIAPSAVIREGEGQIIAVSDPSAIGDITSGSVVITSDDVMFIGLVESDVVSTRIYTSETDMNTGMVKTVIIDPTQITIKPLIVFTDDEQEYAYNDYNLKYVDGSLMVYPKDSAKYDGGGYV